jgi:pimeloyl-ACP methyl ester carboxylesterase
MNDLAAEMNTAGYASAIVSLAGHGSDANWESIDYRDAWLEDIERAVRESQIRHPELPRIVLGYSLGATVALAAQAQDSTLFERGIFFAPAIGLTLRSELLRVPLPLAAFGLRLPSLAQKTWRAHDSTAVSAYKGLFSLIDGIDPNGLREFPACFILDPQDELISLANTRRWIDENSLQNIRLVENVTETLDVRRHLLVVRAARGEKSWSELSSSLYSCLEEITGN